MNTVELDKIAPAFVAAQAEIGGVAKDSKNPAFRSNYASLEAVIDAAKPILIKHQLAFLQMPGALTEHGLSVTTMLLHESGQHISSTLTVPLSKRDPQGAGSAITYACRYSLMAMLGMPPVDDDGEAAMDRPAPRQEAKPAPANDAPRASDAEIAEYCTTFNKQIKLCKNRFDVEKAWKNSLSRREQLGISLGDDDYQRLAGFCKDRIEEFDAPQEAA